MTVFCYEVLLLFYCPSYMWHLYHGWWLGWPPFTTLLLKHCTFSTCAIIACNRRIGAGLHHRGGEGEEWNEDRKLTKLYGRVREANAKKSLFGEDVRWTLCEQLGHFLCIGICGKMDSSGNMVNSIELPPFPKDMCVCFSSGRCQLWECSFHFFWIIHESTYHMEIIC